MKKRIDMEIYPIRISITKERKKLLSSGEVREYKRIRGYLELHELDALKKWKAVKEKDLNELLKLLLLFDDLLEKKIEVKITKEKYPTLYKILKEYELRNEDAWVHDYGIPKIHIDFLYPLMFLDVNLDALFANSDMSILSEEEEDKLMDDVWQLLEDVDDAIYKAYESLGISELVSIDAGDYAEIIIDACFGDLEIHKFAETYLDKGEDGYVLVINVDGSLFLKDCDIWVR